MSATRGNELSIYDNISIDNNLQVLHTLINFDKSIGYFIVFGYIVDINLSTMLTGHFFNENVCI